MIVCLLKIYIAHETGTTQYIFKNRHVLAIETLLCFVCGGHLISLIRASMDDLARLNNPPGASIFKLVTYSITEQFYVGSKNEQKRKNLPLLRT